MNRLNITHKINTQIRSINNLVTYLSLDTYVSGLEPTIYTDYNRLERDYPYNPYLSTFRLLINKNIAVQMIPCKYEIDNVLWENRSYYNMVFRKLDYNGYLYEYTYKGETISSTTYYEWYNETEGSIYTTESIDNVATGSIIYTITGGVATAVGTVTPTGQVISSKLLISKQRNIPINIEISKYGTFWKFDIVSRKFNEVLYITTNEDESNDDIIYYKNIGDYSEIIDYGTGYEGIDTDAAFLYLFNQLTTDGTAPGQLVFTINSDYQFKENQIIDGLTSSLEDYNLGEWYPDFILIDDKFYSEGNPYYLFDNHPTLVNSLYDVLEDQYTQALVISDNDITQYCISRNNRIIYLSRDEAEVSNINSTLWYPYIDMMLLRGNYQEYLSKDYYYNGFNSYPEWDQLVTYSIGDIVTYKEKSYECIGPASAGETPDNSSWDLLGELNGDLVINGINYDTNENYYIKGISELDNQGSYFIIRYLTSRFSRLLLRNAGGLKGTMNFVLDKFVNQCIDSMLSYNNVNSIEIVKSNYEGNNIDLEFNMYINYLMNRKINLKLNINSI